MADDPKRLLKVFLCHASGDKPQVRALYKRLLAEGVDAWLDQEKLLPGQNWRVEIPRAVRESDVVVICLSNKSITKEGYIQKEIKFALDVEEEKPEGSIFLIPARLEECAVPDKLSIWQWVDLYEDNGFLKLLLSLKLRADRIGAVIGSTSITEDDKEVERRINQLYTEGLAAFYTEDWDKACQRFQTILRERPNHKNATEKLEEAERQRDLSKLYVQATEAYQSEEWGAAIKSLEEISRKSSDYKDVSQLLRNARKQKQLGELYTEAKALHAAQKWRAVVKVFDQISAIEPTYQDADGLLPSAQREVAELKRLTELNDLYANAVSEMDADRWYEARNLLEQVHKSQTGFLETERLLRKVEDEIIKVEEIKKRDDQINILYEQANGLVRSRNWRKALEKVDEIRNLDDQFIDKDGIIDRVNGELEKEEKEVQRQNNLAAKYAESVKLLKDGKYNEALDKLQEVKSIDTKYPDRQRVESIARRKLKEIDKSLQTKSKIFLARPLWAGIIGFLIIGVLIAGVVFSSRNRVQTKSTAIPLQSLNTPVATNTALPSPAVTTPPNTISIDTYVDTPRVSASAASLNDNADLAPKYGIDGDPNTFWSSNGYDNSMNTEWFAVDMGTSQKLGRIHVFPRDDGLGFPQNFMFQISDDATNWTDIPGQEYIDFPNPGSWDKLFIFTSPVTARYVRMVATKLGADDYGVFYFQLKDIYPQSVSVSTVAGDADPLMYDDFENQAYDGSFDSDLWDGYSEYGAISQRDGLLSVSVTSYKHDTNLYSKSKFKPTTPIFVEARVMLDPQTTTSGSNVGVSIGDSSPDLSNPSTCNIYPSSDRQVISCWNYLRGVGEQAYEVEIPSGTWHLLRIELYPDTMTYKYLVDHKLIGSYTPKEAKDVEYLKSLSFFVALDILSWGDVDQTPSGYFDYVRTGEIEEADAASTAYRWDFVDNTEGWGDDFHNDTIAPYSKDGYLIVDTTGDDPYFTSPSSLIISAATPIITIRMRLLGQGSVGAFSFVTNKDDSWEGGTKSAFFTIENDGAFHTYDVIMPPTWQDTITQLRLDPVEDGTADSQVEIDYISVHAP